LEKDQEVISIGDRITSCFFVVAGGLRECIEGEDENSSSVEYGKGDHVGEVCLFVPPRTHYHTKLALVTTTWRNELLELTRDQFSTTIRRLAPPLYRHLEKVWKNQETTDRWLEVKKGKNKMSKEELVLAAALDDELGINAASIRNERIDTSDI
jgi:CRP-like cAMP-binding protein